MATREAIGRETALAIQRIEQATVALAKGAGVEPVSLPTRSRWGTDTLLMEQLQAIARFLTDYAESQGVALETEAAPEPQAQAAPVVPDYSDMTAEELEDEARNRGIYDAIEGTGKDGNVLKADLIVALEADDKE